MIACRLQIFLEGDIVNDFVGRLSDRILSIVAPRFEAAAAASGGCTKYGEVFCYCYGSRAMYRPCDYCFGKWICDDNCSVTHVC